MTPTITAPADLRRVAREPRGGGHGLGRRVLAGWPLMGVLVVQAALSLRLLGADTAYQGEAAGL